MALFVVAETSLASAAGIGKSLEAITFTRYLPLSAGTTNVDFGLAVDLGACAPVQSCHWYSNSIGLVPRHSPLVLTDSVSPTLGERFQSVGASSAGLTWNGGTKVSA